MIDRATFLGLLATLALLVWVVVGAAGYEPAAFWQGSSAALVVGGAVFTTLMACPWRRFRSVPGVLRNAVVDRGADPEELIAVLVSLAHTARREGLLALERPVEELKDDFLKRALRMAVDGADARTIEQVCRTELEATDARHALGGGVLESIGRAAPVFGMLGTVIGLILMLHGLNDPSRIGPGMAVALLTTLYGLLLANVICLPLARKLAHRSSEELINKTLSLQGVLAIHAGDSPRVVEQKLRAYVPAPPRRAVRPAPARVNSRPNRFNRSLAQVARLNGLALWPFRLARRARKPAARSATPDQPETKPRSFAGAT